MKKVLIIVVFMFSLPCFATQTIIIKDANAKIMTKELSKFFIKNNCQVENLTEMSFTGKEPINGAFAQLMLSPGGMAGSAKYKYDYTFFQDDKDVIISFTGSTISNDQSVTRFSTPWNFNAENKHLKNIKNLFDGYYSLGLNVSHWVKSLYVNNVFFGSPIQKDDRIKKINGIPANTLTDTQIEKFLIPDNNTSIELQVKRGKELLNFNVTPIYIKPQIRKK